MRLIKKGATGQSIYFDVLDTSSTNGGRKTGIAYNTSGLSAYYTRNGAAAVAITLATQTASGAWSAGGFAEVDATNEPGLYRLDVPDAAFATGVDSVVAGIKGAAGMATTREQIQLTTIDLQDATALGLSRLDAAISTRLATSGYTAPDNSDIAAIKTKTDSLTFTVSGVIDANVVDWKGASAPANTGDAYARLGAPAGASVSADIAAIKGEVDTIQSDVNTGAGVLYTAVAAIKTKTDNLPTAPAATSDIPSAGTVAAAVWDEALSGHGTAGSSGAELTAAGSAGDPWSTALPGLYAAGSAGYIVGNALDAAVSTRLASSGYTAPDNADIAAIKLKTDNLPAAPAATSDIPSAATIAQAVWDALTSALTTVGSIGKLLVTNVDAAITSRLAASGYTAPDNTSIAAIKLKTDNLPSDPADESLIVAATDTLVAAIAALPTATTVNAIKTKTDNLPASPAATGDAMTLTSDEREATADALLDRDLGAGNDSGGRTVRNALRPNRNKVSVAGGTMTVTKEDDTTAAWTATVTTDTNAAPVIGIDPA